MLSKTLPEIIARTRMVSSTTMRVLAFCLSLIIMESILPYVADRDSGGKRAAGSRRARGRPLKCRHECYGKLDDGSQVHVGRLQVLDIARYDNLARRAGGAHGLLPDEVRAAQVVLHGDRLSRRARLGRR